MTYLIKHLIVSDSLYLKLCLDICKGIYIRLIRISDHVRSNKNAVEEKHKEVIFNKNNNSFENLRRLESYLFKQFQLLLNAAPKHAIDNFKSYLFII